MAGQEAIDILKSIDRRLEALTGVLQQVLKQSKPKAVASDRDLDSKYGNPISRFDPRDWTGESFKGLPFSECPPAYLEMVAETLEYFADQSEAKNELTDKGKPVAGYKRADAARARGWAARARAGHHAPATSANGHTRTPAQAAASSGWADAGDAAPSEDDIPF